MKMKSYKITLIPGDGIGREVIPEAARVLEALPIEFDFLEEEAGFGAYEKYSTPLPEKTLQSAKSSDAVLFGAVTTPPGIKNYKSPIVNLRKSLDLYANVRPCHMLPSNSNDTDLKNNINFVTIRENTEGLYIGDEEKVGIDGEKGVVSKRLLTQKGCERIIRFAFEYAKKNNRKKVTLVHKANVIRMADGMFLDIGRRISKEYPDILFNDGLVDSTAMKIICNPEDFDVLVTTNMFGDIISDLSGALVGGLGVMPSASIGNDLALFEPVHGSAPDIAGKGIANPTAAILSVCMMLEYLGEEEDARTVKSSLVSLLEKGYSTPDLGGDLSTVDFTNMLINQLGNFN
jgi:methanogen homoisocitrate dehydrogenase